MTSENASSNARAEFGKATSALAAARALDALGLYDDAASRLYYYAFHLISGALLLLGVQTKTHGGLASLLGQHLVRPGLVPAKVAQDFAILMALRGQADYNRHFTLDAAALREQMVRAEALAIAMRPFLEAHGAGWPPPSA